MLRFSRMRSFFDPDMRPSLHRVLASIGALAMVGFALAACSDSGSDTSATASSGTGTGSGGAGGSGDGPPVVTTLTPNQPPLPGQTSCSVVITDNVAFEGHTHEPICTAVKYQSNPPTSGNHWPVWAAYTTYTSPVPHELLVHDHEHGAIVMGYNCSGACPDIPAAFEAAAASYGPDPLCLESDGNAKRSRIIIEPDPTLPAPIALSSWRATYVATCIDPDSLLSFIKTHYGLGSEQLCAEGIDPADPSFGIAACTGI